MLRRPASGAAGSARRRRSGPRSSSVVPGRWPASSERTITETPATYVGGSSSVHRPGPPSRSWVARAEASTARRPRADPLRRTGRAGGLDQQRLRVVGTQPLLEQGDHLRGGPRDRAQAAHPAHAIAARTDRLPDHGDPGRSGSKERDRAPCRRRCPRCSPAPAWRRTTTPPCGGRPSSRWSSRWRCRSAVNYANDYSDGIRGTDDDRVGPLRLVGSGAAPAAAGQAGRVRGVRRRRRRRAWCWRCTHRLVAGRRRGAGDPGRLVLHRRLQALRLPRARRGDGVRLLRAGRGDGHDLRAGRTLHRGPTVGSLLAAVGIGALACAILVANNLRDIPTDREVGKRTLAVVLGDAGTRRSVRRPGRRWRSSRSSRWPSSPPPRPCWGWSGWPWPASRPARCSAVRPAAR